MMKPLGKEHTQKVAEMLEISSEEAEEIRKEAYATIRKEMAKKGYLMPESDESLFFLLVQAMS